MASITAFLLLFCGSCLLGLSTAAPHEIVEPVYSDYKRKCRYRAVNLKLLYTTDTAVVSYIATAVHGLKQSLVL